MGQQLAGTIFSIRFVRLLLQQKMPVYNNKNTKNGSTMHHLGRPTEILDIARRSACCLINNCKPQHACGITLILSKFAFPSVFFGGKTDENYACVDNLPACCSCNAQE